MKSRALWTFVVVAAVALTVAYWWRNKTPPGVAVKKPKPEVVIQDGKTIDFSSGVAIVKDDAKQKAAIDKAVKEMESALKDVSFTPPAQKPADPTPAPPKP